MQFKVALQIQAICILISPDGILIIYLSKFILSMKYMIFYTHMKSSLRNLALRESGLTYRPKRLKLFNLDLFFEGKSLIFLMYFVNGLVYLHNTFWVI